MMLIDDDNYADNDPNEMVIRLHNNLLSCRIFATHAEISILMVIQIMADLNFCIYGLQNENL